MKHDVVVGFFVLDLISQKCVFTTTTTTTTTTTVISTVTTIIYMIYFKGVVL